MNEDPSYKEEKEKEYQERYRFWTERAVVQFSFSNNLLMAISIAILGYFFKEGKDKYDNASVWWFSGVLDWNATLFFVGTIFTGLSVLFGLIVLSARLYDFNLTRHIALVRKRVYSINNKAFPDSAPPQKSIPISIFNLVKILFFFNSYKIKMKECRLYNEQLETKFLELRSLINGFGSLSWIAFSLQLLSLSMGLIFYLALMLS